jgi:hypothetical protein
VSALFFVTLLLQAPFEKPAAPISVIEDPEHVAVLHLHEVVLTVDGAPPPAARENVRPEKIANRTELEPTKEPTIGLVTRPGRKCEGFFVDAANHEATRSGRRLALDLSDGKTVERGPAKSRLRQVTVAKLGANDYLVSELGPQASERPALHLGVARRFLLDERKLFRGSLNDLRPNPELYDTGFETQRFQAKTYQAEQEGRAQRRSIGPKSFSETVEPAVPTEPTENIELELQVKPCECQALSVELPQELVEKLLDEEQEPLAIALSPRKLHRSNEWRFGRPRD